MSTKKALTATCRKSEGLRIRPHLKVSELSLHCEGLCVLGQLDVLLFPAVVPLAVRLVLVVFLIVEVLSVVFSVHGIGGPAPPRDQLVPDAELDPDPGLAPRVEALRRRAQVEEERAVLVRPELLRIRKAF